ncbi:MAG TPA: SGNH/GDSL hydrolase family protein [Chryseosolibacter sp.]
MRKVWPEGRTINLVFHGHSVPAGYWTNHEVHTLDSYPNLLLKKLKAKYPYAVINIIVTAIGGENSVKGQIRMDKVLGHQPDVLFIDYALNDRSLGIEKSKVAWEQMIKEAKARDCKVILLTPSPDQRVNILKKGNALEIHSEQIRKMATTHAIGLTDTYLLFQEIAAEDGNISHLMSHVNHPNKQGHDIIADAIMKWF